MSPLDDLLERLEASIALLNQGTAPLEDLVRAHEAAARLAEQAEHEVSRLLAWTEDALESRELNLGGAEGG